jgi:hypothetical protein
VKDHRAKKPTHSLILPFPSYPRHPREPFAVGFWRTTVALIAVLVFAIPVSAQNHPQPELRVDVLGPSRYSVQPGLGATFAFGNYARASAVVGYALQADSNQIADRWRADLLGRFLFDPFRQRRWGLSVGGGISVRRSAYIVALLELEGPEASGWLPAMHIGVSGGLRGGLLVRRAIEGRR